MPRRERSDFLREHYRPHLLVVELGTPSDSASGRRLVAQLDRLTESLRTSADYAMCCEEQAVKGSAEIDKAHSCVRVSLGIPRGSSLGG